MKTKRFLAWCLVLSMLMTFMPGLSLGVSAEESEPTVIESSTKENTNQASGIVYTKTSNAKSDGTIDITLTAHTTGEVRQLSSVTPTDIVLVLDTSGSMGDSYTTSTINGYNAIMGGQYTYYMFFIIGLTGYGFNNSTTYYINTGTEENPVYTPVRKAGRDDNGYDMYEYTAGTDEVIVYPALNITPSADREYNYPVVQFYAIDITVTEVNKMTELKSAVKNFIDTTATMNAGLDTKDMHNISIVRFASNASVVAELTPVDSDGAASLKAAVDRLSASGATAVDYGLEEAEEILMNRSQVQGESAVDRNEVIIVFADGEPNHQNGFIPTVANDSIEIAGRMKKEAGVTIYTVCIAEGADAADETVNINKFMHYVSSNYPNATSMTSSGTRAPGSDYYKTIDTDHSLSLLFESIIQEIDHPTITMGEEATMVDTISPYFDFVGTASNVKLQTSARKADGTWAEPVDDNTLSCEITGDRLIVNGFDFDANFISSTGRGDNNDFYGKQLVISFTVTPDYDVIDAASAILMDGIIPTNSGLALLNDSDFTPAAEVETPVLNTYQVTYMVDGVEYTTYNRFKGATVEVDAVPSKAGHVFSGWNYPAGISVANGSFEMPEKDVEIVGTFTPNRYDVEYVYNTTPAGATDLSGANYNGNPANNDVAYDSTVTVAPDASAPGYIFNGWKPDDQSVVISNGTFVMPDGPVRLIGSFTPANNTPYQVIHYTETFEDGVYEIRETENLSSVTDATVTAIPKYYLGFTYDNTKVDKISGTVTAVPMLVLELYYNRNSFEVTYSYTGDVPENPPAHPDPETYKFGESVTVFGDVSKPGYTFSGWESLSITATSGETFEMPNHAVAFIGEFTANNDTAYKVEYYLENLNGDGYDLNADESYENVGTTGSTVYANAKEFEGFTYDDTHPEDKTWGVIAGDGSLVLKRYYSRNEYTLTYAYESNEPQPEGAPELTGQDWAPETYKYDETVTVKEDLELEGFDFVGWHSSGYTVDINTEKFSMPARDVILYGDFEPANGVRWVEKHFFETLEEDFYPADPDRLFEHTGTTGEPVSAVPMADLVGFELDTSHPDYLPSVSREEGGIDAGGETELRFYYKRIRYTISYVYDPIDQPAGANALLPEDETYRFGETAEVAGLPSLNGYDFIGWYSEQTGVPYSGTFEMPAFNIVYEGDFNPRSDTVFEVHHHLQNPDGTYPIEPNYINEHTGVTGESVTAVPRNFRGYELATTDPVTGIVNADDVLILDLFYDRLTYDVTYYLTGLIPAGFTAPTDAQSPYRHGYEVTVLPTPGNVPDTYIFAGWSSVAQEADEDIVVINDNKFIMPMHNVRLVGNFAAATNVPYKIRHWAQKEDLSGYEVYREVENTGSTEEWVTAYALVIPGFKNVTTDGNNILSVQTGQIPGVGTLVIDFYYDRNLHNVTYEYVGATPNPEPSLPAAETDVPFGKEITVAAVPNIPGYTFVGWYDGTEENIVTEFNMPDNDVALKGKFQSNIVDFTVNFWLQNAEDNDYTLLEDVPGTGYTYKESAYVGQFVQSRNQTFTGFYLNQTKSNWQDHVTVDEHGVGNLVLNLYFDRHTYNVTYGYYGEQPAGVPDLSGHNLANVRYGTVLDVEAKPVFSGYSFDGWYTRTATVTNNQFTMPDHDVAFLGRFVKQYSVSYDLAGGTGAEGVDYSTQVVNAGSEITVKDAPSMAGYGFIGWKDAGTNYNSGDAVTVDKNMTFVAQWSYNGGGGGGGGGVKKYTLTYETNGGNNIPKESHNSGKTVKLIKVPVKDGYAFEGWYLDAELTQSVKEVKMTKDITVYASWVKDNGGAGNGHETPGSLNGEDHFAYVVGYPDGTVRPNDNISRAEVTAIFFRLLKPDEVRDKNLTEENAYDDISKSDWHNTAISTMTKLGIVKGRYADAFEPDAFITRAEFATICARFDDSEYEITDDFADVKGHWAEADIHEAAAHGWIRGYQDGTFRPDQFITRAEAMTMINRVLNRIPETANDLLDNMIVWPDNSDESVWYYLAVQEATNSHDYDMKNHIYEKWIALREATDWTKYE